jgi:serine phosphatase RsbU (regulator of sigma subunit)/anti-sigma regulatory factor (Ser/Thr protein kinase)
MATRWYNLWNGWTRRAERQLQAEAQPRTAPVHAATAPAIDIAPNDPIIAYFSSAPGTVEIDKLDLQSPALHAMRAAGVKLVVPLVSQGELIGLLNLGPRLSEQDYSVDDRALLNNLATQAAPALRVAQLVREQQAEAQARERIAQELRVARLIQQTLLPKAIPALAHWQIDSFYQPAREVGGDFYDFIPLDDDRLGIVIGDVTDKGVPAALVMATTRSILRAAATRLDGPGTVLERANDLLQPDIPPNMFVTCLYAILEHPTGRLRYANAGHDLPYRRCATVAEELRATGMPLGLMEGMRYEEKEITLQPGDSVLLYSDGLVEAHNPRRDMFGFPRLRQLVADHDPRDEPLIPRLLRELNDFAGAGWEQEDDITLVTLERAAASQGEGTSSTTSTQHPDGGDRVLAELRVPSAPGNERDAIGQVAAAVTGLDLPPRRLERLKTAVGEATMNAMEHGNHFDPDRPVVIVVRVSGDDLVVAITDQGGDTPIDAPATPDLDAKLDGAQTPRGWGLFLIRSMVDDLRIRSEASHHTVELVMHLKGA